MNVSIIIPTLNEASVIAESINKAWEAGADEVIVIDGGSTDSTQAVAQQHPCRFMQCPRGRSLQLNCGANQATGDILLFLHADNWLTPNGVQQIKTALCNSNILGGAFRQRIDSPGFIFRLLEWGNALRAGWLKLPYGDQGIFLRRNVFKELGGFPQARLMEDLLLMRKFRRCSRPVLLPGPIHVSPRRWKQHGVVRQTLRNWALLAAYRLGISPNRLARFYPRHDQSTAGFKGEL